ncbi:sorting nexin-11 [Chanos chanos]|uniref:Sorting nexin-11 n=1 Tax=Chanos chanos TaxID=29144 RepID=A0A6J2VIL5_CHACN|nr:papilin-like [Chanos chanos]
MFGRMIKNEEEDEFIAVRVQDPRVQNEGSWNSYVDFKIFLHTNSKAFTAKTSCVRRRYSEFVWLKKKLQKNAGLVPVPDLPSKSFFSFYNEDFIERRRKGLQFFLDKVVHLTVCLSDSQLHLFLQTQLPIGHIQDCVQGLTPYTVTDAILTYASSNRGWAQEEESGVYETCLNPVPYESVESPALHIPPIKNEELAPATISESESACELSTDTSSVEFKLTDTASDQPDTPRKDSQNEVARVGESRVELLVEVHAEERRENDDATQEGSVSGSREAKLGRDNVEVLSQNGDGEGETLSVDEDNVGRSLEESNQEVLANGDAHADEAVCHETSVEEDVEETPSVDSSRSREVDSREESSQEAAFEPECSAEETSDKQHREGEPSNSVDNEDMTQGENSAELSHDTEVLTEEGSQEGTTPNVIVPEFNALQENSHQDTGCEGDAPDNDEVSGKNVSHQNGDCEVPPGGVPEGKHHTDPVQTEIPETVESLSVVSQNRETKTMNSHDISDDTVDRTQRQNGEVSDTGSALSIESEHREEEVNAVDAHSRHNFKADRGDSNKLAKRGAEFNSEVPAPV